MDATWSFDHEEEPSRIIRPNVPEASVLSWCNPASMALYSTVYPCNVDLVLMLSQTLQQLYQRETFRTLLVFGQPEKEIDRVTECYRRIPSQTRHQDPWSTHPIVYIEGMLNIWGMKTYRLSSSETSLPIGFCVGGPARKMGQFWAMGLVFKLVLQMKIT